MNLLLIALLAFHPMSPDSITPGQQLPEITQRLTVIREVMKTPVPLLTLDTNTLNINQKMAQRVVFNAPEIRELLFDEDSRQPMRNEVFSIYPARPSDFSAVPECSDGSCYRVEIYNYTYNRSILAIVQLSQQKIQRMGMLPQSQPDIPSHLKELALRIAVESPEVAQELGFKPTKENALMADTKTALNRTRCERSRHLCVAPTFVKGTRALWAIIDLTDMKVAGVRWTNTGDSETVLTERKIQNATITECYCSKSNALEQDGWKMDYIITSSDGLRISDVTYNGKKIIRNAKLVDWHVSYSNTDGFGYSDAVGCPFFSAAAVVAIEKPRVEDIIENGVKTGFALSQNFSSELWPTPCNYNYEQRYEFYLDGRFRIEAASLGRGCGNNGTYRPVTRIAFEGENNTFEEWNGANWKRWNKEGWQLQKNTTRYTSQGEQYRISDAKNGTGFSLVANTGQLNSSGRSDNAYVYVTRHHPDIDEGEADLITIGPCCNTDYRQGPEKFMEPTAENIAEGSGLVLWYVAQINNDDSPGNKYCWAESEIKDGVYTTKVYPCYSGPMFVPVKE